MFKLPDISKKYCSNIKISIQNSYDGENALIKACENGNIEKACKLINLGHNLNRNDKEGHTPLLKTIIKSNREIKKQKKAEKQIKEIKKQKKEHKKKAEAYIKIALKLIESGCDLNKTDRFGVSPLMHACRKGSNKIALKLIESGCNINHINDVNSTALLYTIRDKQKQKMFRLIEKGCDLTIKYYQNRTYEWYLNKDQKLIVEKALMARKKYNTLFFICMRYVGANIKKYKTKILPKDIYEYLTLYTL